MRAKSKTKSGRSKAAQKTASRRWAEKNKADGLIFKQIWIPEYRSDDLAAIVAHWRAKHEERAK